MSDLHVGKGVLRKSFEKVRDIVPVPNLIEIQSKSFNDFVQLDFLPEERKNIGLEKVLRDIFPIDHNEKLSLEYVSYELGTWSCVCGKLTGLPQRYQWSCSSCKKEGCSRLVDGACTSCNKQSAKYKRCSNCLSRVIIKMPMGIEDCRFSGQSFSMPLKIKMQLISWAEDEGGERIISDIKEQDIFFVDLPVMSNLYEQNGQYAVGNQGTFLINGVDRVVVSQLHRSPGAVFSQSKKVKDYRGKPYYLARIIPMRGSWIDFEFDSNDLLYVRIDRKKKLLVTTFLQALGIAYDDIISLFYQFDTVICQKGSFFKKVSESLIGQRIEKGMLPPALEKKYLGKRITAGVIAALKKADIELLSLRKASLVNRVVGKDLVDGDTGEVLLEQGRVLTEDHLDVITHSKDCEFLLIQSSGYTRQPTIALTLAQEKSTTQLDALKEIHVKVWPGDSSTLKEVQERLENLFFNPRFYDLTQVGRIRMNTKLGLSVDTEITVLTVEDIVETVRYLVNLKDRGEGALDDIDHLGNRRVRLVGELLSNQVYLGFLRIERIVRERFRMQELHSALMPQDFLNVKPLGAVLREFFGLGQLSQFMDQTNPLAEIAHKRRLSALGPGGVMKDRATYEIRDVHTSHYGRICPIETPEGQTVGLISSLATYATVNNLGFIETGYRPVENNKAQDRVEYLDAFQEEEQYIAQADFDKTDTQESKVFVRHKGKNLHASLDQVAYADLSPKQIVSVSSALIPFLEHDDATRALMGANMQRQAVPLIAPQAPIVGTGMEREIAKASGAGIVARRAGTVRYVSSEKIIICVDGQDFSDIEDKLSSGIDTYYLRKFERSSYSTLIHHAPIVKVGDVVRVNDMLTNGSGVVNGELALGSNLLVAFMPWHGYNFEDAIVLNKRLVADDSLTSVHVEEFAVDARDTKLGPEEITKDIPNINEQLLAGLDDDGIVRIGSRVKPGDILVGKVTLKGDIQYSPEEKLLRAIFGEKSREVRDTSLRVPPGISGTVVDVKIFSRSGSRRDKRYKEEVARDIEKINTDFEQHCDIVASIAAADIVTAIHGKKASASTATKFVSKGLFDKKKLADLPLDVVAGLKSSEQKVNAYIKQVKDLCDNQMRVLSGLRDERVGLLKKGDLLPSGVIKVVKVFIAMKRSVSVGDKIAGRHGNKGIVSVIVPREDMPHLEDGTAVDIVLNPLGVPSRMNVGQILETILGLAGRRLGERMVQKLQDQSDEIVEKELRSCFGDSLVETYRNRYGKDGLQDLARHAFKNGVPFATPVFDSANYNRDIKPLLSDLNLPEAGTFRLKDGRTGDYFDQPVTVGVMYIMKLNHMVDDKLHARSVGPYSLVTQQPLGGKAQMGGQRLGEMEVWALEAYGAAYALQEMLTYKSDDVSGRHKVYEAIVRGEKIPDPGIPESFNVLIKELQSLGLQVDLFKSGKEKVHE